MKDPYGLRQRVILTGALSRLRRCVFLWCCYRVKFDSAYRLFMEVTMKRLFIFSLLSALLFMTANAGITGSSSDWPQWQGSDRTNISQETGLLKSWDKGGPPLAWSIKGLGEGYGSLAIKDDRIF